MGERPRLWAGKYGTTGHGGLIISDEFGNIIFVSAPAPGCDHDMRKLEGEVKEILDLAGSVIADKGFQGSGYVTPAKKPTHRELCVREHDGWLLRSRSLVPGIMGWLRHSARERAVDMDVFLGS